MQNHSQTHPNEDGGPWYKQFWAWFVFTPLIIVVIACSVFVTIAFKGKEDIVSDDYYKVGRMINQEFEPSDRAKSLGLVAELTVVESTVSDTPASLRVTLNESEWLTQESLVLHLSHPADEDKDHFLTLKQVGDLAWKAQKKSKLEGRWYLRLSSITDAGVEEWRVQGEIQFSESSSALLK